MTLRNTLTAAGALAAALLIFFGASMAVIASTGPCPSRAEACAD